MIYNLINGAGIIIGTLIGLLLKKGVPENISNSVMKAIALAVLYIGLSTSFEGKNTTVMIVSLAIGTVIGEILNFDKMINELGNSLQKKLAKNNDNSNLSKAFVTTTILFCAGAMGIVGAMQAGLNGNGDILIAKTMIDSIVSVIFTATLGYGVIFSSISVVLYQGIFVLLASILSSVLSADVISSISAVGGISIIGLSINLLFDKDIKIANMLPSIFIPIIFAFLNII